jgi:glycosyltransferase involved in cell wall biosynthesis
MEPLISVVMAVYNNASYLDQSIQSILRQTYSNFEFIIIDDGSTDETHDILQSYKDPRIILVTNNKNLGLAKSLNHGLELAKGDLIARQDADDVSHPERFEAQAEYLDLHPNVGVVAASVQWIDGLGDVLKVWPIGDENAAIQEKLLYTCPIIHGSTMLRHKCLEEVGGYDDSLSTAQDYDLWLRISERWEIVCLPEILYEYRWHDRMVSNTKKEEQAACAKTGLDRAVSRRIQLGLARLGLSRPILHDWVRRTDRRRLAQRFTWWSAGARTVSKPVAFRFLAIALLLDPVNWEAWFYLRGILSRKLAISKR